MPDHEPVFHHNSAFSETTMTKPNSAIAPSLLDAAAAPVQAAPGLLSRLGDTAPNPADKKRGKPIFRFIVILLLLAGLVAGAAVLIANNAALSFKPANPPAGISTAAPVHHAVAVTGTKTAVAHVEVVPAQVATIINDLPAPAENKTASLAGVSGNNPHDRLSAALASKQSEAIRSDAAISTITKAGTQLQAVGNTANAASRQSAGKSKPARADSDDRDVSLLAALVATTKEVPAKKTSHANSDGKTTSDGKNNSVKDDGRNQDIVERKPGDSTASLLRRCKKLGVIEGELCRWRICSERWDSDPACKTNAQPKAPVADNSAQ